MSEKLIELINHYDLILEQMNNLQDEARAFHSSEHMVVSSSIAAMLEMKLKSAIIILMIP